MIEIQLKNIILTTEPSDVQIFKHDLIMHCLNTELKRIEKNRNERRSQVAK
jgi:hypothetical protein